MSQHKADIRILGGLPVTVSFLVSGPDRSVGIFSSSVEEYEIVAVNGRKYKGIWIEKRIDNKENDAIFEACRNALTDGRNGW